MTWSVLAGEAPELARLANERLEGGVALLGSVRRDGSPRISPVEPYFAAGQLLFGAMSWSGKVRDLLRDPRCVLHSAVSDPGGSEGEAKLYGRAVEIERAAFVSWDAGRGLMRTRRWSLESGYGEAERSYP